jgi:diguanylate cyclase (GGDEF)-like protein
VGVALFALCLVVLRAVLTFKENRDMLRLIRTQAVTDELTGLRNRRRLIDDLAEAFSEDAEAGDVMLLLFDLDGFKRYNDTYGHPAGDALLARLGRRLAEVVDGYGYAYRLGGDEFCVLARVAPARAGAIVDASTAALTERSEGFSVRPSFGVAFVRDEAASPASVLKLADQRLYAQKHGRMLTSAVKPEDVMLRVMQESEPTLRERARAVSVLAVAIGEPLGMRPSELADLARAGELHDIGKLAIPDVILEKTEPLDAYELQYLRRHSTIGERILGATPSLAGAARLVRATHERWDGAGYPDGLSGEAIPLGARIIAVCDAFVAMTSERPHRYLMSGSSALKQIRECAGSQFDPTVVEVFLQILVGSGSDPTLLGYAGPRLSVDQA